MFKFQTGIIGLGHVGSLMKQLFPNSYVYDINNSLYNTEDCKQNINNCDISFICVPTPESNTGACDTSIVEEALNWCTSNIIVIRSTVPVGFTDLWNQKYNSHIIFQPEYYGETQSHQFANPFNRNWITLGGEQTVCQEVAELYKTVYPSDITIHITNAKTAELAKYMENCYYATKVTFCNVFYDIAESFGVNYDELRETWLLDPRINKDHTMVYKYNRGYGGSCLPKDLAATVYQSNLNNINIDFLKSIQQINKQIREDNK